MLPTKMKAVVLHGIGDLRYEEVSLPHLAEGEAANQGKGSRHLRLGYQPGV